MEEKYIEISNIKDIEDFLIENNDFEDTMITRIFKENENAQIYIDDGGVETQFIMNGVKKFDIDYYASDDIIDSIEVIYQKDTNTFLVLFKDDYIFIETEKLTVKTLDTINTKYQYVSVKYKEDSDKTFYYISDIDDLKVGDFVYVPVRNDECIGIVENIEWFSCNNVPFPINRTKKIIRKSTVEEFENFNKEKNNVDKIDDDSDDFEFEDKKELYKRVKYFPILFTQKVEWQESKQNEDGTFTFPFPKYDKKIMDWIQSFYDLKLVDHNYLENYQYYKDKDLDELNFEEILSYITYIIRGERFCDGLIAGKLEDGTIEKLCKNLSLYSFEFEKLTERDILKIKEKNVMFFTLAEGGAMGCPYEIEIVTREKNILHFYRTSYNSNIEDCIEVEKLYPIFPTLKTLKCGVFGVVSGVNENFVHIDTGMGNHLFVNKSISEKVEEELIKKPPYVRYRLWLIKALDILDYNWNEINIGDKINSLNEIIIGYYGAVYFGGGTYEKLSKRENEDFKIEYIHSAVPNYIPNGEKYIKVHDKINFTTSDGNNFIDNDTPLLTSKNIENNYKVKEVLSNILNLDLEKMAKTKYYDKDMLDGLCWEFYIQLDDKKYKIDGYENLPEELEEIIDNLKELSE